MKIIMVSALKGGTGKTTTTVNLARAYQRAGCKVGLLDVDATAPTLHRALGLTDAPHWELDSAKNKMFPFEIGGLYALTMASHYGEDPAVLWDEPTLIRSAKEIIRDVIWPADLDYLLLDSPPSSSGFMQALYDFLGDQLYGVILVYQPTSIAQADLYRSLNFIKVKKVPLLGMIANMGYCIAPNGDKFWPFTCEKVEMKDTCSQYNICFLGEIPLTPRQDLIDAEFDKLLPKLNKPVMIQDGAIMKLYKSLAKKTLKTVISKLPSGKH